jgi:glycosyltransferase involved in cell wall biosynthesis
VHLLAYTDAESFGGAEQALATLLAHLDPAIRVTVVGTDAAIADAIADQRPGAGTRLLPTPRAAWDIPRIARHVAAMWRLHPDVCHVNLRTPYACVYGQLAALLTPGTRTIAVEHLMLEARSRLRHRLKRWMSRRLSAHLAVSERTARLVERDAGLPTGSVAVIHNGVRAKPAAIERKLRAAGPVVGSAGRLVAQKGFDVLVDALVQLDGVTAVVAGDGPERDALERKAEAAGVADRFLLPGWADDVSLLMGELDIFVLPSRFEGLPLTLLEAMQAGLPIVATDVGGIAEAVTDRESALLVAAEDAPALASAITVLLEDRELGRRLGSAAHARWRAAFDVPVMVAAYERVYRGA